MLNDLETAIVRYPLIAQANTTVLSAVEQMHNLSRQGVDAGNITSTCVVVVVDGQQVLGTFTERDVISLVAQQQPIAQLTLKQFLQDQRSPSASLTISESALSDVATAIAYFEKQQITHLPVVNAQNQLVGVLLYEALKGLRDLSHHQATASQLQASELKLKKITENLLGMFCRYVLHPDGCDELTYVSSQSRKIFELEPEVALADVQQLWSRIHPDDIARIQEAVQYSAVTLEPFTSEYRLILPQQGLRWVYNQSRTERLEDGTVVWDGVVLDSTDRKNAEIALQDLSARLEFALKGANIGIWEWQISDGRLLWDDRMYALYGIAPEEFSGKYEDWFQRVHPDDRHQAQQAEKKLLGTTECHVEFRIIRPDGAIRYIDSFAFNQCTAQGEIQKTIGLNIDITDIKLAQAKIHQQIAAIEAVIDGIAILQNEQYLYLNQAHADLYGYSNSTELISKSWRCLYSATELARFDQEIFPKLKRDRSWQGEAIGIRKDGSWFHVGLSLTLLDDDLLICVCRDISDRKEYEQQLERSNMELMQATRLKDDFLANMSHELRTPLNAILGMTEILQEEVFGDLNDRQQKSLKTIENSSNHLLELINDILDVAKIEAGQIELYCQPTNITDLCQSSLAFIKQQALNKNIQIELAIASAFPAITIDERRIRQVLINLLNNAAKFTPNGGKITLQVSYVPYPNHDETLNGAMACDTLEISVIDTGIGIAPEHIHCLFQPFVQVESSLNRNYNGTGLGLALVKRLVELHGGRVRLTSELGVGSCFTIVLPVTTVGTGNMTFESSISINSELDVPHFDTAAPVILLGEDNEANITTFVDYLSLKGYHMVVANNGQMAIDLAKQTHPDVILMDIQMPGMDGLEAIQQIRQQPEFTDTPIIALTAFVMSGDRERCLAAGANDYLSKPVKLKQLVKQINAYLGLSE